ncbi:MAG: hypoxanthine phosphoribosyltransferase [Planctomycetota bacterium]|nr:hypoxanthine phosphoribosyltransferase [Planctomycetota bacterium]
MPSFHADIERVLFSEEVILEGIDRVARAIVDRFDGRDFTVVSILKGSCIFSADLIRRIPVPLELAFVSASSYRDRTTSGELEISFFPTGEIEGRNLLLVDDILDTGQTMSRLKEEFLRRGASEVATCVFLDKPSRRAVELDADFKVLEVDDLFVVGYGLDFDGRYRNLPYVGVLRPELYGPAEEEPDPSADEARTSKTR